MSGKLEKKQWEKLNSSNRAAKGLWNRLNHGKQSRISNQADKTLAYKINNPQALDGREILEAKNAGLDVKGQYCVTKTQY